MKKKATIVDIANSLGITPSAVSKAFSNHPRISAKTKEAVLEAAERLGYQPNTQAVALRKGKSGLVGVLVPGIHYSFFATAIRGIEDTLSKHGYHVLIAQSHDDYESEKRQLESLRKARVDGILAALAMTTTADAHFRNIAAEVPLVLFDRTIEGIGASTVTIDDYGGAVLAVNHLADRGYQRIAHLAGYRTISAFRERIRGYQDTLHARGLPFFPEYLVECRPNENEGETIAEKLLRLPNPPEAFFAASDFLALGVLRALKNHGRTVPDVGVVGFSNEPFAAQVTPGITTIEQFSEMMGVVAAKALVDQLEYQQQGREFIPQRQILTPRLIVRETT